MAKLPTRSPTHEDVPLARLSQMGLELEDIAEHDTVELGKLVELAEDRGRPPGHYLAAVALATELRVAPSGTPTIRVCAGTCQRYGSLDLLDHLAARGDVTVAPVTCLDRCDQAPACELDSASGKLVLAPASAATLDEAIATLR